MIRLLLGLLLTVSLTLGSWLIPATPAYANSESMFLAALPGLSGFFAGQRPTNLGVKDGKLAPCPGSPNCVVSQGAQDGEHAIAPIAFTTDPATALATLKSVVTAQPRTEIIEASDNYLCAEFASQLMGFVDDVEFYLDPAESVIHVRSASRLGQSDLGVNRKRIETIRAEFTAAQRA
ncbi:MAG: DUF1499 domain-containing protein [Cyanobacteria bacterium Co-bin13]|nr:DUF1499 domain-containing protein [Cyanobacteria bacterium Co-bin13]